MIPQIRFGTDGWRGAIADNFTFDSVRRATQGFANYLLSNNKANGKVVVGYDQRFLSDSFAKAASEVLAGNGFLVYLTVRATPSPAIAFSVPHQGAVGAINITASHNPPSDNGLKVRDENGGAIDPDGLEQIEAAIPESINNVKSVSFGDAIEHQKIIEFDPAPDYIAQISSLVDIKSIKDSGLTILIDPMWGNGIGWFPRLLNGGKTKVVEIHNSRNPIFPEMNRPEPIPPNADVGLQAVLNHRADVLILTDGDADRVGVGDEKGRFINQLRVHALLTYYLLETRGFRGPIVKTVSSTYILDEIAKAYNVAVYETAVGFKFIAPKMIETNALIGGEESGGFAFKNHVPERDGILAGLFILDMLCKYKLKPSEIVNLIFKKFGESYYNRIDVTINNGKYYPEQREDVIKRLRPIIPKILADQSIKEINRIDGYKLILDDGSWLLLRPSGTEALVRIYAEAKSNATLQKLLSEGQSIIARI